MIIHQTPTGRRAHRTGGFTLIELLVVLVILGLLAGLVGPQLMRYVGDSRSDTARLQIQDLASALDLYRLDVGTYPATEQSLEALVRQPAGVSRWRGPYLRHSSVPQDPWSRPYHYRYPGEHAEFDIWTNGANGRPEGEGEDRQIGNWH